jgi:hypothetical protein
MLMSTSATLKTRNALMLLEARMMKVKEFKFMVELTMLTRDGRSSIKTNTRRLQLRDLIKNSVSRSIDHSILYPTSQFTELLSA